MGFSALQRSRADIHAWLAFLLGAVACALAIAYFEVRKEPSGLLAFDVSSTQPGTLKIFYTKDGRLTDPGWAVNFSQGNISQAASFPLSAGQYELIGFKPFVEASGKVSISNLRFLSGSGVRNIKSNNFVAINQLHTISSQSGEVVIAPAQGANDPFGAFPNLQERVPRTPFSLSAMLWISSGTFALMAVFLMLMYGLSSNLPFARGAPNESKPEPSRSQWLGFLTVGLIVLYLRNVHSIFIPVLYAEDGTWSAGLINRGFIDMMFNARDRGDYFVFGNVVLLALAQLSNTLFFGHNLTYLPHFVSFFSLLFYAALAAAPIALLRDALRIEARLLLWLFVLLVPLGNGSYEVLGRLSNIGFAFLYLAFCLLVWRHYLLSLQNTSRKGIVATDAMLLLCANTNPLCYPLIVIAIGIEAWHHWTANERLKINCWLKKYLALFSTKSALALVMILFLMGLWLMLRQKMGSDFVDGKFVLSNIPEAIIARTFLYPIIFPFYSHFNDVASGVLLLIVVVVLAFLSKDIEREKSTLVSAAVVLVVSTVIIIVSRPILTEILDNYQTTSPDRYYYGLTFFVYLVLASALSASYRTDQKRWRRMAANTLSGGLIALYAGNGALLFEFFEPRFNYLPKLSFLDEVKNAYGKGAENGAHGMSYKVALHPAPWSTNFPADYVTATVFAARFPPFNIVTPKTRPLNVAAHRYEGKVVHQTPAGRGREDGWFYVSGGARSWIPDGNWLKQKKLLPEDVIEITSSEFATIPDSGEAVK